MDSHIQGNREGAKDFIKISIENNYKALESLIYDEVYKKVESEFKRKQKEREDNAYIIVNNKTYVDEECSRTPFALAEG